MRPRLRQFRLLVKILNQADLDWSAVGLATYDFTKWFSLSAGYKAVGLD
jgi:hypothetical protein